ncbi:Hypothetical protein PFREUD_21100 [Propionibacterium freudenreichii subsp. shermanii CIRM-BIA1]|uniref:Uncharacterized protein n=1 Tax=Propionibacterium freudenreichii subsp. shermanii (strain ATCC 9614 / DSM 4902 / CIP 103027 / NCIMB 8099 / CIRM-BIA1) TaxID=754252 RepID=D7GGE5_PROFC|nr:Hypothetical protein PFREUD_21100 [Propionibacterium freudenreichii subsp. shermanii CIRM-BIA1]
MLDPGEGLADIDRAVRRDVEAALAEELGWAGVDQGVDAEAQPCAGQEGLEFAGQARLARARAAVENHHGGDHALHYRVPGRTH